MSRVAVLEYCKMSSATIERKLGSYPLTLRRGQWGWSWRLAVPPCHVLEGYVNGDMLDAIAAAKKELEYFKSDESELDE
jgi:hypothetical protein